MCLSACISQVKLSLPGTFDLVQSVTGDYRGKGLQRQGTAEAGTTEVGDYRGRRLQRQRTTEAGDYRGGDRTTEAGDYWVTTIKKDHLHMTIVRNAGCQLPLVTQFVLGRVGQLILVAPFGHPHALHGPF